MSVSVPAGEGDGDGEGANTLTLSSPEGEGEGEVSYFMSSMSSPTATAVDTQMFSFSPVVNTNWPLLRQRPLHGKGSRERERDRQKGQKQKQEQEQEQERGQGQGQGHPDMNTISACLSSGFYFSSDNSEKTSAVPSADVSVSVETSVAWADQAYPIDISEISEGTETATTSQSRSASPLCAPSWVS